VPVDFDVSPLFPIKNKKQSCPFSLNGERLPSNQNKELSGRKQ
jgi:hypothetical protein